MTKQRLSGRAAFLKLLQEEGVTHVFGNPGTTELALMEAMPEATELKYVLGLQESVVLSMADGFARATGRLTAVNLHCTPGLGHAMGALYNAKFSGSPMIVTAGQYELGYGLLEPMLYEPLVPIAEPLVKWAYELQRVEDLPRVVRRAAKIALTPPCGPVFLSLPGSILDDVAELDLGFSTRVEALGGPSKRTQGALVDAILSSKAPIIIAGRELAEQDAFAEAQAFAELIGAPVYHEPIPYNARYPSTHAAFMGDLSRNQAKVRELLGKHDLLIVLGGDLLRMSAFSQTDPMPNDLKVIHISEREWELGKNYSTHLAVRSGAKETLAELLPQIASAQSPDDKEQAGARLGKLRDANWTVRREELRAQASTAQTATPIDPRVLAMTIADAVPSNAIVIEEAPTTAPLLANFLKVTQPRDFFGLASGGLGFAMGGAVGAALGRRDTPVVALVGDGSAMYAIQALWTAAHEQLPITYVIVNNKSYRIIKERLVAMRNCDDFLGMDLVNPALDFVEMARGMGVTADRVADPSQLASALRAAIESRQPQLLEVIVDAGTQAVGQG
ncbi:thiamine pyrophosphate-binding protein [Cupriavidus necator]|uniref:thiamine pyrophosphate-binding protein n=1 Tax=Cupriavidus necator TaxID=106590 RepID=UPI0027D81833|nr:thiamine pyrophosphate-dependent enzyme [Cupriavidus necator]